MYGNCRSNSGWNFVFFTDAAQRFVGGFRDVLLPLAIAAILATLLRPVITFLEHRTRLNRTGSILLLLGSVLLTIVASAAYIIPPAVSQTIGLIGLFPDLFQRFLDHLEQWAPPAWQWLTVQIGGPPESTYKTCYSKTRTLFVKPSQGYLNPQAHYYKFSEDFLARLHPIPSFQFTCFSF